MRRRGNKVIGATGVYDENLTYDSTNIATQYPNANNTGIDSTGNVLTATASDGEAISILKTQDGGQENFVGLNSEVVPFQGKYEFANISEATVSDTLVTSTPIADGDNLVILKDDNSIQEVVASGVTYSTPNYSMDTTPTTQGEIPSRVYAVDAKASFALEGGFVEAETDVDSYVYEPSTVDINDIFGDGSIVETYQFNGNKNSLSGNNNATGTLSTYGTGVFGQSGLFSTAIGEMNTTLNEADDSIYSISIWLNNVGVFGTLVGSATATSSMFLMKDGLDFRVYMRGNEVYGAGIFVANEGWVHLCAVHNETDTLTLYKNGVVVGSGVNNNIPSTEPIAFGQNRTSLATRAVELDQARFFNRELTQEEVISLYNEGLELFKTTRTYKDLAIGSDQTLQTKVELKSTGDKMTELTASILKAK